MALQKRFHIWFGDSRTTITVDEILFELMAVKLKYAPDDESAHSAVREWLQDKIISSLGEQPGNLGVSQYARRYLIDEIADKRLSNKRWEWLLQED